MEESETPKKTRKFYTYQEKADIIHKYLEAKSQDASLELQKFAESEHMHASMLSHWLRDQNKIYRKCYESYDDEWKNLDLDR